MVCIKYAFVSTFLFPILPPKGMCEVGRKEPMCFWRKERKGKRKSNSSTGIHTEAEIEGLGLATPTRESTLELITGLIFVVLVHYHDINNSTKGNFKLSTCYLHKDLECDGHNWLPMDRIPVTPLLFIAEGRNWGVRYLRIWEHSSTNIILVHWTKFHIILV